MTSGIWEINGGLIDGLQRGRGLLYFRPDGQGSALYSMFCDFRFRFGERYGVVY